VDVGYLATQLDGQLYGGEFDGVAVAGRPSAELHAPHFENREQAFGQPPGATIALN